MKKSTVIWLWGGATGVVSVIFYQLLYATSQEDSQLRWFNVLIMFLGLFIGTMMYRNKANGGYLTFGEGFKAAFLMTLILAVIMVIATALDFVLHPDMIDKMLEKAKNDMINQGRTDEQIEVGMHYVKMFSTIPMIILFVLIGELFFGAILSLISAGLCTRKKPMFDEVNEVPGDENQTPQV